MGETTKQQETAIHEIAVRGDSIVTVEYATELLAPFGFDPRELRIVYTAEAGIDWGAGAQRHTGGEMVDISTLAWVLAETLGAPEVKYDTNYGGAGRRARAVTAKAILRLRIWGGEHVPTCEDCGSAELLDGSPLCWACNSQRNDKATVARVISSSYQSKFRYEVRKGSSHIKPLGKDEKGWSRPWWDWKDMDEALEGAYNANREAGLIGPVLVMEDH